ncbi:MAG: hypothetical protein WC159_13425 [Sphaerochaetaceae bacterium]
MRKILLFLIVLLMASCSGCDHAIRVVDVLSQQDCLNPTLVGTQCISDNEVTLIFNEPLDEKRFSISSIPNQVGSIVVSERMISVVLKEAIPLGTTITLSGRVKDKSGNSTSFSTPIWAKNNNPAKLLINEFTTKGTEKQPDRVELLVTKSGNLSGITISDGTPGNYDDRIVFSNIVVWKGEYVTVQFQKGEKEGEYQSEHLLGLGSNNGCVSVLSTPLQDAIIEDCVVYSNKTGSTYGGYGNNDVLQRVNWLYEKKAWKSLESKQAVDSTYATSTRSLCRYPEKDTEGKDDWYVCALGKVSFGKANASEEYKP